MTVKSAAMRGTGVHVEEQIARAAGCAKSSEISEVPWDIEMLLFVASIGLVRVAEQPASSGRRSMMSWPLSPKFPLRAAGGLSHRSPEKSAAAQRAQEPKAMWTAFMARDRNRALD